MRYVVVCVVMGAVVGILVTYRPVPGETIAAVMSLVLLVMVLMEK